MFWIRRVSGNSGNVQLPGLTWNSHSLLPDSRHFKFCLTPMSIKLRQTCPAISTHLHRFVCDYRQSILYPAGSLTKRKLLPSASFKYISRLPHVWLVGGRSITTLFFVNSRNKTSTSSTS